jgi:hypothetical protein
MYTYSNAIDMFGLGNASEIDTMPSAEAPMNLSYSYVSQAHSVPLRDSTNDGTSATEKQRAATIGYIKDITVAFNVKLESRPTNDKKSESTAECNNHNAGCNTDVWESTHEADSLNEFEDMQELLVGAFPQVFMLGKTYPKKKSLRFFTAGTSPPPIYWCCCH